MILIAKCYFRNSERCRMNNGRREIFTDLIPTGNIKWDRKIIPIILENALQVHNQNVADYEILVSYYYNKTSIEKDKTKVQQPEINNIVQIPYANIAVTTINSYCFSNPLSRNSRSSEDKITQQIKLFNDALDNDNYDEKTVLVEMNSGIYGLGYRFARPANEQEKAMGYWFKTSGDLDPKTTFCVKANNIDKEKVLACTFYKRKSYDFSDASKVITKEEEVYNVYTKYHYWVFIKGDDGLYRVESQLINNRPVDAYPITYGRIPIVEYPRKQDRTSDFELAIGLIDASNKLASSRIDDVQQAVDYVLLLRDIDTDTEGAVKRLKDSIKNNLLSFKSIEDATVQPEISVLNTKINQSEVQTLQDFVDKRIEEALYIPSRETRGSSGDTGLAVESRAGYRSLENVAGLVTKSADKSENENLDLILAICSKMNDCPFKDLKVSDIEIKANRNKVENITTASNAYATLINAGMNDEDALSVTQIVPDAIGTASRNRKAREEKEQRERELQTQSTQQSSDSEDNN